MQKLWVQPLVQKDPLEKEMATHSSSLVWRIPWTEEPGGLQSMESQKVGHNLATEKQQHQYQQQHEFGTCHQDIKNENQETGAYYTE